MSLYLGASLVLSVVVVSSVVSGGTVRSLMGAVLALVATVVCVSLALFKLAMDYVAMVYLLVYIGAVLILLMFVVLSVDTEERVWGASKPQYSLLLLLVVTTLLALQGEWATGGTTAGGAVGGSLLDSYSAACSEQQLAWEFFGSNGFNLVMVAFLLFMAMVGAVVLAL